MHPVHERERTPRMRLPDQLRDIVDGAERVGGRPYRQQARAGSELPRNVFLVEAAILGSHPDGAYLQAALFCQRTPGVGVRVVVELGHDHHIPRAPLAPERTADMRSEEHTSELQSQSNLVCRLLLEKKNKSLYDSIEIVLATSARTAATIVPVL